MKKILSALLSVILIFTVFSSTALAGSAPSAMSHFSSAAYNKTFEDDQGITHTIKATKVSEVWNKIGSILHIIEMKETYTDADGDDHVIVKDDSKIYSNACPKYPDNPHQTVYRVEWYPDGHSTVKYDYRPVSTPALTASPKPTARPTTRPTAKSTMKPTVKPTLTSTTTQTTTPTASLETSPESTVLPTVASDVSPSLSPMATLSLQPTTAESSIAGQTTTSSIDPTPTMTSIPVQAGQGKNPKNLVWILVVFSIACGGIILLLKKRRKEPKT